jgi:CspA family cold shock protein
MPQVKRYNGEVKWFDAKKGYGFIGFTDEETKSDNDVFVHYSVIEADGYKELKDGDKVTFAVEMGKKNKLQAVAVRKV